MRNFLITAIALCLFLYMGFNYVKDKSQADSSLQWKRVSGTVLGNDITASVGRRSSTYYPHVTYRFNADGQKYTATTISFPDPSFGSRGAAEGLLAAYPRGGTVSVYFDPKAPAHACLKPGATGALNNELVTAFLFVVMAAFLALFPPRYDSYYGYSRYQGPQGYITPSR